MYSNLNGLKNNDFIYVILFCTFIHSNISDSFISMITEAIIEYGTIGAFHVKDIYDIGDNCKPEDVHTFESQVNTTESTLTCIGDQFPNLRKLRLNNSVIYSIRDIGCTFSNLRFLSLARCGITSLCGISTISNTVEELYLAFNKITDVSDLMGMDSLQVIDLEENQISDLTNIEFLTCCSGLKSLTLTGNPCVDDPEEYRVKVAKLLPSLVYLDEKRLKPKLPKPKEESTPRQNRLKNNSSNIVENNTEGVFKVREPKDNNRQADNGKKEKPKSNKVVRIHEPDDPPQNNIVQEQQFQIHEPSSEDFKIKEPDCKIKEPEPYEDDDEIVITEMLDDLIEDRPPTSNGNYEQRILKDKMEVPPKRNRTSKGIKFRPRVVTPRVRRQGRCVSSTRASKA